MLAVEQWNAILERLGVGWDEAELSWIPEEEAAVDESAAVLGPLGPGRIGSELRIQVRRRGSGPNRVRNLLERLDEKRIWGTLALVDSTLESPAEAEAPRAERGLAQAWDAELARLAPGWRDLLCELELDSSDYVPRAALLGAPLNPTRRRDAIAIRFRVSRGGGYGASPGMARRCLERMDAEGITGEVTVLHGLSDTDNVYTQGPVWRIGGRSV
jgi:hypothetical protein